MRPEHELVPYAAGRLDGDPVLVLAPHPDDEVFGCGGFLARAADQGRRVRVLILTDGAAQGEGPVRRDESREAARRLGLGQPVFAGLPDRRLEPRLPELRRAILEALEELNPELVLLPSPAEVHPDHRATALAAFACCREAGAAALAAYEVSAVLRPNVLLDVGEVWPRVLHAGEAFTSQLEVHPYLEVLDAIATARRLTLGPEVRRAEAYFRVPAEFPGRHTALEWAALQGPTAGLETAEAAARDAEDLAARLRSELTLCRDRLAAAESARAELEAARRRLAELETTLEAITRSRTWRLHCFLERLLGRG